MIWIAEDISEEELSDLRKHEPFAAVYYDVIEERFYWETAVSLYSLTTDNGLTLPYNSTKRVPIDEIQILPFNDHFGGATRAEMDEYAAVLEFIKHPDRVPVGEDPAPPMVWKKPEDGKYYTADISKLNAFAEAIKLGYKEFELAPVWDVKQIQMFRHWLVLQKANQVRQGILCDNFDEMAWISTIIRHQTKEEMDELRKNKLITYMMLQDYEKKLSFDPEYLWAYTYDNHLDPDDLMVHTSASALKEIKTRPGFAEEFRLGEVAFQKGIAGELG